MNYSPDFLKNHPFKGSGIGELLLSLTHDPSCHVIEGCLRLMQVQKGVY